MAEEKINSQKDQWLDAFEKYHEKRIEKRNARHETRYTKKEIRSEIIATVSAQCFYHLIIIMFSCWIINIFIIAFQEGISAFLWVLMPGIACLIWIIIIESVIMRSLISQIMRIKRMKKNKIREEN